ncbi:hypothetical protein IWZ03DRAFT_122032 [Phyllosticta citriasiana]|uniref:Uncharacterized protein n=1 Tax=Phyllosticta citriasiana TaxID=595635 RepID=A0ABR1K9T8_9PEZI
MRRPRSRRATASRDRLGRLSITDGRDTVSLSAYSALGTTTLADIGDGIHAMSTGQELKTATVKGPTSHCTRVAEPIDRLQFCFGSTAGDCPRRRILVRLFSRRGTKKRWGIVSPGGLRPEAHCGSNLRLHLPPFSMSRPCHLREKLVDEPATAGAPKVSHPAEAVVLLPILLPSNPPADPAPQLPTRPLNPPFLP